LPAIYSSIVRKDISGLEELREYFYSMFDSDVFDSMFDEDGFGNVEKVLIGESKNKLKHFHKHNPKFNEIKKALKNYYLKEFDECCVNLDLMAVPKSYLESLCLPRKK
jgi:hypothetical protein